MSYTYIYIARCIFSLLRTYPSRPRMTKHRDHGDVGKPSKVWYSLIGVHDLHMCHYYTAHLYNARNLMKDLQLHPV